MRPGASLSKRLATMNRASALLLLGFLANRAASAQFLNHRPFPTYSLERMPDTEFSCRDKILGGYYADPQAECQMFHVCVKVAGIGVQDFRFLCPNGTAFDQDHQICAEWEDVDCDSTTLYYSSDNFDLYRIGSGFESKAVKYGEDEEPFALQRAETGDIRVNREHQAQRVNQQKEAPRSQYNVRSQPRNQNYNQNNNNNNNNNNDKEIFKGSSSSNFFNNRNNGKENDEDYDDNVNVNQNRDYEQRRKNVRTQTNRRPVQQNRNNNQNTNNNQNNNNQNANNNNNQNYNRQQDNFEAQTKKPNARPTGFKNNFAGSYAPTTPKPSTAANQEQYSSTANNLRTRNNQRGNNAQQQYNNADNFRQTSAAQQSQNTNSPTPTYTISTPAPFKQTQQYNIASRQTQTSNKPTENYPQQKPTTVAPVSYNANFDVQKTKQQTKTTENYPSNNPQYSSFDKKPTTPVKNTENYPSTLAPKPKPFSVSNSQQNSQSTNANTNINSFPTTFAPRTNAAYTQIAQQTTNYNKKPSTTFNTQSTFNQQSSTNAKTTPKSTPFTQYTPTVPKVSSTTPVPRSNRFDETQYDDGSYDSKYDKQDDEFLKTAHSQNIASSRNEYARTTKQQQQSTQTAYNETPRPFSVSSNTPKSTTKAAEYSKPAPRETQRPVQKESQRPVENKSTPIPKKVKDVSYDYAYYDSGVGSSEPDYEIDTELKKSTAKN